MCTIIDGDTSSTDYTQTRASREVAESYPKSVNSDIIKLFASFNLGHVDVTVERWEC